LPPVRSRSADRAAGHARGSSRWSAFRGRARARAGGRIRGADRHPSCAGPARTAGVRTRDCARSEVSLRRMDMETLMPRRLAALALLLLAACGEGGGAGGDTVIAGVRSDFSAFNPVVNVDLYTGE